MNYLQPLLKKYDKNRVIRALIQLVPIGIGSAIDILLTTTLEKIKRERATVFFDELARGDVALDPALLESEDFLHAFFSTTKYALNSRRREKIIMFASLLKNALTKDNLYDIDEYEEFLKILDDLSYRELLALKIIDDYSLYPRTEEQNDLQWTNQFWHKIESRLSDELHIGGDHIYSFMNRLTRTGCYELFRGGYFDPPAGSGKLTPTYKQLKKIIEET